MKDAGGIPLLKSNIPEFSTFLESDNLVTGRSNNPWNPDHTLARTVRDVALGYSIINGADGIDGYSIFAKNAGPATFRLPGEKIRVGWMSSAAFQLSLYHSV